MILWLIIISLKLVIILHNVALLCFKSYIHELAIQYITLC